jgi:large subunit ribosomal protein L24
MKPTKMRNQQIYRAPYAVRSKQVSGSLSKDLRKKYGKRSIRLALDDSVKIIRGEYKGIDGKITKISIDKSSIAIEGIKKEKLKGEKIDVYIPSSNILVTSLNTDDHWRKSKLEGKKPKSTPKVTTEKPKVTTEKPKVTAEKPKVTAEKPKVTAEKPKVTKQEKPKDTVAKKTVKTKSKEGKN